MFPTNIVSEIRGQISRKHCAIRKATISDLNKLREKYPITWIFEENKILGEEIIAQVFVWSFKRLIINC